jgi:3-phenylpropionate/trans-cinnamate dioxygenase ferredoxin reductase subunit
MSPTQQTFIIVGASLTGAKAAETLREEGFAGRVILVGAEPDLPYERPPLTKEYLRAESPREKAYVHPEGFYDEHNIELITDTAVTELDAGRSQIRLDDGSELGYDRLLLATGAEPRRLSIPGADLDGVHYLRTLADCDVLRDRLDQGGRVAVVGAGWIGAEFAASARQRGAEVALIDPLAVPLERVLGPEVGAIYRDVHAEHGVEVLMGSGLEGFEGDGALRAVKTSEGRAIECDFAVVGVGVVPRVELAERAGLEVDNGIVVDQALATSAPGVYAAGDVASAWHPFYRRHVRVEHWANALNQGPAAARAMLGEAVSYDRTPYFFSDQYDVGMEYSGFATEWDEVVFRGDPAARELIAFWLAGGRVVAGMNVNVWDVNEHVQALIRSEQTVDAAALADPHTPLESLIAQGEPAGRSRS